MKTVLLIFISGLSLINSLACKNNVKKETVTQNDMEIAKDTNQITITVGSKTFNTTLIDSPTTKAFKTLLPITIDMKELNGNEKYFDFPESLPTNAANPKSIQNGDLMLYGSNTLVLFYEPFSTSYSYTKIGKIDNPEGLMEALGSGQVEVTFKLI